MQNTTFLGRADLTFSKFFAKVLGISSIGLLLSGFIAFLVSRNANLLMIYSRFSFVPLLIQIGLSMYLMVRIHKLAYTTAFMIFMAYCALMGFSLSFVAIAYSPESIALCFGITAIVAGSMAIIGLTTRINLVRFQTFFSFGIIALLLMIIASIFIKSVNFNYFITLFGLILFLGFIAYDVQKIRMYYLEHYYDSESLNKLAIIGSLMLFLDLVNLFLYVLRIFGKSND